MRLRTKVMLLVTAGYASTEYVQTLNTQIDRQTDDTSHPKQRLLKTKLVLLLLLYWRHSYGSTVPGQWPTVTLDSIWHLTTNTGFLRFAFSSACTPQRPGLENYPDYVFSFHLSSVLRSISYLPSTFYVFASPSLSLSLSFLFSKLSLRASEMTLSRDTKLPTVSGTLITT